MSLLELPYKIRENILREILTESDEIRIRFNSKNECYTSHAPNTLLLVSRLLRAETLSTFYTTNTFQIFTRRTMASDEPDPPQPHLPLPTHHPINHHLIENLRVDSTGPWLRMFDASCSDSDEASDHPHQSLDINALQYLADVGCRPKKLMVAVAVIGANRAPWYLMGECVYRERIEGVLMGLAVGAEKVVFRANTCGEEKVTMDGVMERVAERKGMRCAITRESNDGPSAGKERMPGRWVGNQWVCVLRV